MDKLCKRILAVHDISGFGHTSLMAVIPLIYKMGIRVCALPTAVLSANTDYPEPQMVDLSQYLESFALHWKKLGLSFDAIHTGFLTSPAQAEQIAAILALLSADNSLVLVDPVMGDHGELYTCYNEDIIPAMRKLVTCADIITPNYTEAALLAGADPILVHEASVIEQWCRDLSALGPKQVVITSVPGTKFKYPEVWFYDANADSVTIVAYPRILGVHPGAGDCFAALLLTGIIKGYGALNSLNATVQIMTRALGTVSPANSDLREGIPLEEVMQWDLLSYYASDQA